MTRPLPARLTWIGVIAFASGFPFGLVNEALPVYLRKEGVGLFEVGLITTLSLPWTFKFLWAPLVDRYGTRRRWIVPCLAGLAGLTLLLGAVNVHHLSTGFWVVVGLMVTLSATQDIAIDAYTIETTTERELGVANSVRIALYRIAMFVSGGAVIWLAGERSWRLAFAAGAAGFAILAAATGALPRVERERKAREPLWEPLRALLTRPGIGVVIVFALTFKLDVALLEPMMRPFWVDRGLTLEQIGGGLTTARILATLAGSVLGGILTTRWGLGRALWALGALQALSALAYWGASAGSGAGVVFAAAIFENFAAAMGTAAFVAYLMSVAERRYAATQYALLSALLALTRSVAGPVAGQAAQHLGYSRFFLVSFVLGLPAFALIPLLRRSARPDEAPVPASG